MPDEKMYHLGDFDEVKAWARKRDAHDRLTFLWRGVLAYKRARPALFAWLERAQKRLGAYEPGGAARERDIAEYESMWE